MFPMCFFEGGDLIESVALKFERCEHRHDTSIVDGEQEGVIVLIVICVERQEKKVAHLGLRDRTSLGLSAQKTINTSHLLDLHLQ